MFCNVKTCYLRYQILQVANRTLAITLTLLLFGIDRICAAVGNVLPLQDLVT